MGTCKEYKYKYFIAIVMVFIIAIVNSFAQLSPGDLASPHSHLEGMSNCTECHTLGEKISDGKCLACHTHIDQRIKQDKGYHASAEVKNKACVSCHSDHHGLKFDMINFDKATFNHDLTGYLLEGKHGKIECKECHKADLITNTELRNKKRTFLGLQTSCLSCHDDYHQKTLSNECNNCHDFAAFKPASHFDHQNTKYPLKGKHSEVSCKECHKISLEDNIKFQKFTGLNYQKCTDCHLDVHENKFGQNCTECHSETSFFVIKNKSKFDHNSTDYPLEGAHQTVKCEKCHPGKLTTPVKHNYCTDCHQDYHTGDFKDMIPKSDCKDCHTVQRFSGSLYTLTDHQDSDFPLKGAHQATPCFICHQKNDKWVFSDLGKKCSNCHEDIHNELIDKKYYPDQTCESCHSEFRWDEIKFDHNKTDFELQGAHESASCRSCHFHESEEGKSIQKFNKLGTLCAECHQDIHQNQFADSYNTCSACHNTNKWKPNDFNHDSTRFSLDGKHINLECKECHETKYVDNIGYTYFKTERIKCEDCH